MFSDKDLIKIKKKGISVSNIEKQLFFFKKGDCYIDIQAPATSEKGIRQITIDKASLKNIDVRLQDYKILKFVPASGAASRMFKSLFTALNENTYDSEVEHFMNNVESFAFYEKLRSVLSETVDFICPENYGAVADALLNNGVWFVAKRAS